MPRMLERLRRFRLHRLSLKLAAVATALAAVLVVALRSAYGVPPAGWALAGLLALGVGFYLAAHRLLAPRIELARRTLRQIRKHRFEGLEHVQLPRGDEMNALIWQVYRTGQALEKEIAELRKIENYRREFLGNVSHELKTPIFSIQGFAETLRDGALDDPKVNRSFVEKILRNAARLHALSRDLTEISRIETGQLKMVFQPFDLRGLVTEIIESLEPQARAREVRLASRLPADLPSVHGDRERLRQVLVNLIENAIKYNHVGGHVDVVARSLPEARVKVSVVDDGIGIAPQHLPRLTERFYRADKSRSRGQGGTGLGLAIVKHILQAHGATLLVESRPGRGSSFGFILPAGHVEPAHATGHVSSLAPSTTAEPRPAAARG